jgi:hypothetical protein
MEESKDFTKVLSEALEARRNLLETSELAKLKEEFRTFQMAFSSLYKIFLKKGLIHEDPYKQEARMGEIEIPESGPFSEAERVEQLSIRLANYDNQLDFLVNFYQFSVEFLNLERIKRVLSLVKYIDWVHLNPDVPLPNTKAVAELVNQSKIGIDPLGFSVIGESALNLSRSTGTIMGYLKGLTDFHRETYKLEIRTAITGGMPPAEAAQIPQIKKKFAAAMPGKPFYPDLAEEVIREDYSKDSPLLRENVLKKLQVAENKPKAVKQAVSFKTTLIDGVVSLGSVAATLGEIAAKIDENAALLANRKRGFWEKFKQILQQMLNKEPEPAIYDVVYMDAAKGVTVREKVNYQSFRGDMERKMRTLTALGSRGAALGRIEAMPEDQITSFLERAIREVQTLHKTLSALDEFFKKEVEGADRDKIKGIKPELATMKNAIVRANQKRHEYSAQKEEEEQLKRLGINLNAEG